MLDGFIGRGFASKCKSSIKATKARIELIRKKRSARERFLKKDISDLLANGLDTNAYGRIEGLMSELTLSSCYDFVEQCCDLVYKQLSAMQKQSECPSECKVAVASLMFAAARVSDLPELRDLRETFQEKYGNSLQYSVNQKFVENLSSPSPTMEKKIQLMQNTAAEYSISWNCSAFEKQISKPPVHVQEEPSRYGSVPRKDKFMAVGGNSVDQKDKNYNQSTVKYKLSSDQNGSIARNGDGKGEEINMRSLGRQDFYSNGHMPYKSGDDKAARKADDDPTSLKVKESHFSKHQLPSEMHGAATVVPTSQLGRSSYGREQNDVHRENELQDNREVPLPKREMQQTFSHGRQVVNSPTESLKVQRNNKDISANIPKASKSLDADKIKARSLNKMIPPPYVKPPKAVKAGSISDLDYTGYNRKDAGGSSRDVASRLTSSYSYRTGETHNGSHHIKYEKMASGSSKGMGDGQDDIRINLNGSTSDLPLQKSVRKRHSSRSSSGHDDAIGNLENAKVEKRRSSSHRRSDTKQGLQILFDEEPCMKDEEKELDKLLIHFSTKPTNFDPEKLRKSDVQAPHQMPAEASGTRRHVENKVKPGSVTPLVPSQSHTRSISFPHEHSVRPEPAKVFARAASFQPDRPAKHVHPNLPDCDDLAARIAALRGS